MHLIVTIILERGLLKVNLIQYNFRYRNKYFFHYFSETQTKYKLSRTTVCPIQQYIPTKRTFFGRGRSL